MDPLETGANAPAVPSAPEPSPAPAPAPTTVPDDDFIRVPKDQLGAWDGRFGEVISRAKTHDEYADWLPMLSQMRESFKTPQEFVEYYNGLQSPEPDPNTPPAPEPTPEKPFSKEDMIALLDERDKTRDERTKTTQAQEASDLVYKEASAEEDKLVSDVLKGLKAEPDTSTGHVATAAMQYAINKAIQDRLLQSLPSFATAEDKAKVLSQINSTPSTAEDRKAAMEQFSNDWKDVANQSVASFAEADNQIPAASIPSGAGGPQDAPNYADMTGAQYDEAMESGKFERDVLEAFKADPASKQE